MRPPKGAWKGPLHEDGVAGVVAPLRPHRPLGLRGLYLYSSLWPRLSGRTGPREVAERFNATALASLARSPPQEPPPIGGQPVMQRLACVSGRSSRMKPSRLGIFTAASVDASITASAGTRPLRCRM